jgi:hypothetical protein
MKTLGVILLLGVAGLLAAVSVAHSASADGTLQGVVGPGFSITLTQNGTKVTHLDPGTYTISVDDESADHNFHLSGPGVDQTTDVAGMGTTTWTVTFADGTFFYQCDVHSSTMHGSFTVGNVPTTTTAPPVPTPAPLKVRIVAAKVIKPRTVRVTAAANRRATLTATLWKAKTKVATAHAAGASVTLNLVAKAALKKGAYVVKLNSGGASASKAVSVR